jgi:uncharacterized protein (TIGR03437 family)
METCGLSPQSNASQMGVGYHGSVLRKPRIGGLAVAIALIAMVSAEGSAGFQAHYIVLGAADSSYAVARDVAGNVFIASTKTDASGNPHIHATKSDTQGNELASFEFGVGQFAFPAAAGLDPQGNFVVTGTAYDNSPDSPRVSGFVVKFDGQLKRILAATTLGQSNAAALLIDNAGNIYVGGSGGSPDLVTPGAFQTTSPPSSVFGGPSYAFLVKLSPDLSQIIAGTYFGGNQTNCSGGSACIGRYAATGISSLAKDSSGNIVVAGATSANDLPVTPGVYASACGCSNTGTQEAASAGFIVKFSPDLAKLVWSTFLPVQKRIVPFSFVGINALAIDRNDNVVVAGSAPIGFPVTAGALQTTLPLASQTTGGGFVAKLDSAATHLVFATYFGDTSHNGTNNVASMAIDSAGNIWVTGESTAAVLPISPAPALGPGYIGSLSPEGAAVSTFLGAPHGAVGRQIAVDKSGGIVVLGARGSFLVSAAEGSPSIVGMSNFGSGTLSSAISSGEVLSLYGYGLGPAIPLAGKVSGGIVASSLDGYQVLFNGVPAPLLSFGWNQIDCIVPAALGPSPTVQVRVITPQGTFTWGTLFEERFEPQIVQANGFALALNQDGTVNSASNPAVANSVVTVWATGIAPVLNLTRVDGEIVPPSQLAPTDLPVSVSTIQTGVSVPLAVLYAGDAPNQVWGISQINFRLPASLAASLTVASITLQIGTFSSNPTGIYVKP